MMIFRYWLLALCLSWPLILPAASEPTQRIVGERLFQGALAQGQMSALQEDYRIQRGDQVTVHLWGGAEFDGTLAVDAKGNLYIPLLGPVKISGLPLGDLNRVLQARVRQTFRDNVQVYASLETSNEVPVYVSGYVNKPGVYTGLQSSSVFQFIDKAGGIDLELGSFIDIQLKRKNKTFARFNAYQFLQDGYLNPVRFRSGDVIVVGPRQAGAYIEGAVAASGRVEFADGAPLSDFVPLVKPLATATDIAVSRVAREGARQRLSYSVRDLASVRLQAGDVVTFHGFARADNYQVLVSGRAKGENLFLFPQKPRLKDLVNQLEFYADSDPEGLQLFREAAKVQQKVWLNQTLDNLESRLLSNSSQTLDEAKIKKEEAALLREWIAKARESEPLGRVVISSVEAAKNMLLEDGDQVYIPSRPGYVSVFGDVISPSNIHYQHGMTAEEYLAAAGGPNRAKYVFFVTKRNGRTINITKRANVPVDDGDVLFVAPKIGTKSLQIGKEIAQVLYHIAASVAVISNL